ncbi:MAG: DUF1499 domain-containing protein [Cyanobacteria bacterium P01_H01_bin.15]
MRFFNSVLLAIAITLTSFVTPAAAALPGMSFLFEGQPPADLGITDGAFKPCPASPNCVSSQATDAEHKIEPLEYSRDLETTRELLGKVLSVVPRTKVTQEDADYVRTESASRLLGFVDDAEFYFPRDRSVIEVRSASRLGESDLGVNRRRIEQIRLALQDLSQRLEQ